MTVPAALVRLRPFTAPDFAWLHEITADPAVTRYTDWGPNTPADTRAFLRNAVARGSGPREYSWAVTLANGEPIGSAGLELVSASHRRASFGYVLDPRHWGRGYATATALEVGRAARKLGVHRLEATCHPDNQASARVLEKAGLRLEGRMRDHLLARGQWRDSLLFAEILEDRSDAQPVDLSAECATSGSDRVQRSRSHG